MKRLVVIVLLLAACGGGRRRASTADAAAGAGGGTGTGAGTGAGTGSDGGAGGYRAITLTESTALSIELPESPVAKTKVVTQSPVDPDPCTLGPEATFAWLEGITEGRAALAPETAPVLAVRCDRIVPRARVVTPAGSVLELAHRSHERERHVIAVTALSPAAVPPLIARIPLPLRGARVAFRLPREGIYRLSCELHPGEVAHVLASDHPYAMVASEDTVRFGELPAPPRSYTVVLARVTPDAAPVLQRKTARSEPEDTGASD